MNNNGDASRVELKVTITPPRTDRVRLVSFHPDAAAARAHADSLVDLFGRLDAAIGVAVALHAAQVDHGERCGLPDCEGPKQCEDPGCEALHPNGCSADPTLAGWSCGAPDRLSEAEQNALARDIDKVHDHLGRVLQQHDRKESLARSMALAQALADEVFHDDADRRDMGAICDAAWRRTEMRHAAGACQH